MIKLKTPEEIAVMKEGGEILKEVVQKLRPSIEEGITTLEIDELAENMIREKGAEPSFQKVPGYKWTICSPINEQVVHTPPSDRKLLDGDVFSIDIGVYHRGFHTDFGTTWIIGKTKKPEYEDFLKVGKETLDMALGLIDSATYVGEISALIEKRINGAGYHIMKSLTGHGIGRDLHEEPSVPGFLDKPIKKTAKIQPGLVIAIEVIYSMGTSEISYEDDWSIKSKDNSMTGCFEHTIAVTDSKGVILT